MHYMQWERLCCDDCGLAHILYKIRAWGRTNYKNLTTLSKEDFFFFFNQRH